MINLGSLVKIAFKALLSNKTRTLLTMLGMIIGVGAVITMLAIGQGSRQSIQSQVSEMGTNLIMIFPASQMLGGVHMGNSSSDKLSLNDMEAIRSECKNVSKISPEFRSSGQLIANGNNYSGSIYGGSSDYINIKNRKVSSGRNFTEAEVKRSAKVCLIGTTVIKEIFGEGANPIGKMIRYNSIPLQVIGILESKGENNFGQDQDDLLLAPYTTVQKRILAVPYIQSILCSSLSPETSATAVDEIEKVLKKTHKIGVGQDADFEVRAQEELIKTFSSVSDVLTVLLAAIAGISLIIGGIGIMNIMFVSVTERTREIGLRMAIGANENYIMIQFLTESIILSIIGGLIGILIGFSASYIVENFYNWPVMITSTSVLLSFGVCMMIGIFFGWYPARKAASLNPIDALRTEQ